MRGKVKFWRESRYMGVTPRWHSITHIPKLPTPNPKFGMLINLFYVFTSIVISENKVENPISNEIIVDCESNTIVWDCSVGDNIP